MITDKAGKARWVVQGTWDEKLEGAKVLQTIENKGKTVYETGPTKLLWQRRPITYVCVSERGLSWLPPPSNN